MSAKKVCRKLKYELIRILFSYFKRIMKKYNQTLSISAIKTQFLLVNPKYKYFHHYFGNISPEWFKKHRKHFSKEQEGFREDAFRAM